MFRHPGVDARVADGRAAQPVDGEHRAVIGGERDGEADRATCVDCHGPKSNVTSPVVVWSLSTLFPFTVRARPATRHKTLDHVDLRGSGDLAYRVESAGHGCARARV